MIEAEHSFQEGPNSWLHAFAVCAIGLPLLAVSLAGFFLLFTQTSSRADQAPINAQVVEAPRPPPKPAIQKPRKSPVKQRIPLPSQPSFPDTLSKQVPVPPDTETSDDETSENDGAESASLTGTASAYAVSKPMPEIPKEFRGRSMDLSVTVKFKVDPDGNADAELIRATPDPKLNQWLLAVFKRWRFYPAIKFNQGVASELVITVPIKVY